MVLREFDEVHGKKRGNKTKWDTWWWNKEGKESTLKKDAHKVMC